jgi:FlaA1/EpsC-like NDP-sugar epimerase
MRRCSISSPASSVPTRSFSAARRSFTRRTFCPRYFTENDLAYFQKATLLGDLLLIVKGVWVTFSGVINWKRFIGLHLKILIADVLLIEAAYLIAHLVRYSGLPPAREWDVFQHGLLYLPPFMILGMAFLGCYRNPVRFFFTSDALRLSCSISVLWLAFFVSLFSLHRDLSLYLVPLVWVFLQVFLTFPRVVARVFRERIPLSPSRPVTSQVIVYGAGKLGQALSGLISNNHSGINLVGFIDDDPEFRGRRINGFEVIGRESDIPTVHSVHKFGELWVTFTPDEIKSKRLHAFCHKQRVKMILLTELDPFSRISAR